METGENWITSEPYYDLEKQSWYIDIEIEDSSNGENIKKETKEYFIPVTEYEIEKSVDRYLSDPERKFSFTPSRLYMTIDKKNCVVYFKDIADKVVIYDKYLTNANLYEENIRPSSFIACAAGKTENIWTKYESNNFFYYVDISNIDLNSYDDSYPKRFLSEKITETMQTLNDTIAEYKKISDNNPQKVYFIFLKPEMNIVKCNELYNFENKKWERQLGNVFINEIKEKSIICDINDREKTLNRILDIFRYYNIGMYGSTYEMIQEGMNNHITKLDTKVSEKISKYYYDLFTGKKFTNGRDIFKEGVSAVEIIRNYSTNRDANKVNENSQITLGPDGIEATVEGEQYVVYVSYDYIRQFLNVKEIKSEILPSSTRIINKSEIINMNKDELYRAYNEIFARHGHDFKTPEYKFYFNLWDWYKPISGKIVTIEELSDLERENFNTIKSVIDEK